MGEHHPEDDPEVAAALRAVRAGSEQVQAGRRQPELKSARARRDRAIVKAVQLVGHQKVVDVSGLSAARVKQICDQHRTVKPPGR